MAGGLQPNAVDEAVIQRRYPEGGDEIIKVNLQELLEKGDMALNVVVRGGDVIHIQERLPQTVYVIGEVNRAGAYQLPPKQDLRVSQMFAWAGGPMKTAKMSEGILLRYNDEGRTAGTAGELRGDSERHEGRLPGPGERHHFRAGQQGQEHRLRLVGHRAGHDRQHSLVVIP